jgi:hypothetical protein
VSAVTDAVRVAAPSNPVIQSVRDSLVVAKRNLIRMSRIPNPVRAYRSDCTSPRNRDRRPNALKEQVK